MNVRFRKRLPRFRQIWPLCFILGGLLALLLPLLSVQAMTPSARFLTQTPNAAVTASNSSAPAPAAVLNQQGSAHFSQGQLEKALESWEAAAEAYREAEDHQGEIRARLNQVQALKELGFHKRGLGILEEICADLAAGPDSLLKAIALQRQGDLLRIVGELDAAQVPLVHSITMLEELRKQSDHAPALGATSQKRDTLQQIKVALASAKFGLAEIDRDRGKTDIALEQYKAILATTLPPAIETPIQLARMELLAKQGRTTEAKALGRNIQQQLEGLPPSHSTTYYQINLAETLLALKSAKSRRGAHHQSLLRSAKLLASAAKQAEQIGDVRAQAYALGSLGQLYETTQQWKQAQRLTQQASSLSQSINAPEMTYRWLWQMGRIARREGHLEQAKVLYREALTTLQSLRQDLVAINPNLQFSFREDIEPLYRELVDLLLSDPVQTPTSSTALSEARSVIESLQVAELENFLRRACDVSATEDAGQIDGRAAVVYPIILPDRLEIIVSLPQQALRRYSTPVNQQLLDETLRQYREGLVIRSRRDFYGPGQKLYEWLVQPMVEDLEANAIETLVFVLDGSLKNVPVAALYNGQDFLLERYKIAITPGLQLLGPKPLENNQFSVLAAGISEASHGFSALKHVEEELASIQQLSEKSQIMLNHQFTTPKFRTRLQSFTSPILHLATHGQFSSNAKDTFLLAWDAPMSLKTFDQILRGAPEGIELLVLSACETAQGDERAALGLTGIAVEAGAKSTVATLWSVDDAASAVLMQKFYEQLKQAKMPRAEALRQAQLSLLKDPLYRHPLYWAPYVMVGNWL